MTLTLFSYNKIRIVIQRLMNSII